MFRIFALFPILSVVACNGKTVDSDSAITESESDADTDSDTDTDTDTDTDSDADSDVTMDTVFLELATHQPIANAAVTVNDVVYTTDAGGQISVTGPAGVPTQLDLNEAGYVRYRAFLYHPPVRTSQTLNVPAEQTVAGLSAAMGISIDPTKAIVLIAVFKTGEDGSLYEDFEDVSVALNASYEVALAADAGNAYGYSPGNTTLAGSISNIVFVNVTPGTLSPSFTTPDGRACARGWGEFEVAAGTFVGSSYMCVEGS